MFCAFQVCQLTPPESALLLEKRCEAVLEQTMVQASRDLWSVASHPVDATNPHKMLFFLTRQCMAAGRSLAFVTKYISSFASQHLNFQRECVGLTKHWEARFSWSPRECPSNQFCLLFVSSHLNRASSMRGHKTAQNGAPWFRMKSHCWKILRLVLQKIWVRKSQCYAIQIYGFHFWK